MTVPFVVSIIMSFFGLSGVNDFKLFRKPRTKLEGLDLLEATNRLKTCKPNPVKMFS